MMKIPQPYQSPSNKGYRFRPSTRFDDVLVGQIEKAVEQLRPFGYESESDIIRTAVYEFCNRWVDDPGLDVPRMAARMAAQSRMKHDMGDDIVLRTVSIIREFVRSGMQNEASRALITAIEELSLIEDIDTRKLLIGKLRSSREVQQIESTWI